MLRLRSFVSLAAAAALAAGPLAAASTEVFVLGRGGAERVLPLDTVHAYPVDLRAGEYLSLRVDQRGVDVELRLFDPASRLLLRLDSPNGAQGPEDLFFVAEKAGRYRVEVGLRGESPGGRYQMSIRAHRQATPRDRRRAEAMLAFSHAGELDRSLATQASAGYLRSAELWQGLHEEHRRAEALRCAAEIWRALGALRKALALYEEAYRGYQASGKKRGQALMLNESARCYLDLSETLSARTVGERALAAWRKINDPDGTAAALQLLGELSRQQGNLQAALSFFQEEMEQARSPTVRARALLSLGVVFAALGDKEGAQQKCQEALLLLQTLGESVASAQTLTQLGSAFLDAGDPFSALSALRRAWFVLRKSAVIDRHDLAVTLAGIGKAYFTLGDLRRARDYHQKALELLAPSKDSLEEASIWNNLGRIEEASHRPQEALDAFHHALLLAHSRGFRELEVAGLLGIALTERQRGNPIAAGAHLEKALGLIEATRGELTRSDLQISYFAKREDLYGFAIDLLMEQHKKQPASEWNLRAFTVSERSRSHGLLARIAQTGPGSGAKPLPLSSIQRQILGNDTLLLEYYLSEPKSYLWAVSSGSVVTYEIAGREVIESQVRQVAAALSRRGTDTRVAQARLLDLGRRLLAPVASQLAGKRLLFVPHGALQSVPFTALADPDRTEQGWTPLIADHEIVVLPSVSVLAALRHRAATRQPAHGKVAVIGAPVLSADDPHLPPLARMIPGPLEGGSLEPVPFTRQESDAISRLVPSRDLLRLVGLDANRDQVLGDRLAGFGVLHFSTHGLLDVEHPERSALVLSRFDPSGGLRRGLLRVEDIEAMRLRADLVVLSACETARGREVRGEGVIGLTRSFMIAGADRVLVSLWKVDDQATAVLMGRFYQKLIVERRTPAAALREAQLSMWREAQWSRPYQWAGFLLQGSWD
jgi:CHAT domain-containing protein